MAVTVTHGIDDKHTQCEFCEEENTMIKLLTKPIIIRQEREKTSAPGIGTITNEYIEKNREVLEAEKQKAKKEVYEPS